MGQVEKPALAETAVRVLDLPSVREVEAGRLWRGRVGLSFVSTDKPPSASRADRRFPNGSPNHTARLSRDHDLPEACRHDREPGPGDPRLGGNLPGGSNPPLASTRRSARTENAVQVPASRSAGPRARPGHMLHLSDDLPAGGRAGGGGWARRLGLRRLPTESGASGEPAQPVGSFLFSPPRLGCAAHDRPPGGLLR